MQILLVNPPIYDFTCYDYWLKPLGLLYVASFLRGNTIDFDYFDFMDRKSIFLEKKYKSKFFSTGKFRKEKVKKSEVFEWFKRPYYRYGVAKEKFLEFISNKNYDYVFITSMMTYWYEGVKEVIESVKEKNPNTKIIIGGVYTKLLPEHAKELGVSYVFTSDVDDLYQFLIENTDIKLKKNFSLEDLIPAYDLYPELESAAVLTQRGCPYRCSYCAVSVLYKNFSCLPFDNILGQLDLLERLKVKDITFYDDALLFKKEKHFLPLFEKIIEKKYSFRFNFSNGLHVKFIEKDVMDIFKRINLGMISLSIETISEDILSKTGNKTNIDEIENALDLLLKNGFDGRKIFCYILVGLPNENLDDVIKTAKFLKEKRVRIVLNEFTPVPRTDFYIKYEDILKDPLLTNKSVFSSYYKYSEEEIQNLKNLIRSFNRETKKYYERV
ncbi:MAG: radical SAM protein [candidate division WOR-3 bacterium]